MTGAEIKKELKSRGIRFNALARELGVCETSISFVVNKKSVSDRIQKAIATRLGKEPAEVFPDYYQRRANKTTKPESDTNQEN